MLSKPVEGAPKTAAKSKDQPAALMEVFLRFPQF
jgi:hypothetical protein